MGQIANTATAQKNLKLTIGTNTYEKHVSSIQWNNAAGQTITWQGGTPDATLTDQAPGTWSAAWNVIQDWDNDDSLCNWLLEHDGEQVEVEYMPKADGTSVFTATITVVAPSIGGAVNAFNESTVNMASTKPVKSAAA